MKLTVEENLMSHIHPNAIIGENVTIGPFSIIEDGVTIGDGCEIGSHVVIRKGSQLGKNVIVDSFTAIGGLPQARSFNKNTPSGVIIGDNTIIREGVTIHRSMYPNVNTILGSHCFLMGYSHVAHDCVLGNYITLTNNVLLGGHVKVGDFANLGGGACVHQRVRVGMYTMIGGNSCITSNAPPFLTVTDRNRATGLNLVGMRRQNFSKETLALIKKAYKYIYKLSGPWNARAQETYQQFTQEELKNHPQITSFLNFFQTDTQEKYAYNSVLQGSHSHSIENDL